MKTLTLIKFCTSGSCYNIHYILVPPRWILEPTDKAFAQGSDAKVECKADGFPKPQVTWKRAEGKFQKIYFSVHSHEDDSCF
jgi:hypothetical protein